MICLALICDTSPVFLYLSFLNLFSSPFHFRCLWLGSLRHHYVLIFTYDALWISLAKHKASRVTEAINEHRSHVAQGTHWAFGLRKPFCNGWTPATRISHFIHILLLVNALLYSSWKLLNTCCKHLECRLHSRSAGRLDQCSTLTGWRPETLLINQRWDPLAHWLRIWRSGSAHDSRSKGWEFEPLCGHFGKSVSWARLACRLGLAGPTPGPCYVALSARRVPRWARPGFWHLVVANPSGRRQLAWLRACSKQDKAIQTKSGDAESSQGLSFYSQKLHQLRKFTELSPVSMHNQFYHLLLRDDWMLQAARYPSLPSSLTLWISEVWAQAWSSS